MTIDIASPASGVIKEVMYLCRLLFLWLFSCVCILHYFFPLTQFLVKEGDTVEPGNKVAIISMSADAHVAPSENIPEKPAPKPSPPAEKPKVESTKVAEKPKAPSPPPPKQSAKEPQLPPKDRERRVSKLCHLVFTYIMLCLFPYERKAIYVHMI